MAADYAALEARVTELEHQMRNVLAQKIDAVSYGVGIMHAEMTEQFGDVRERLGRLELGQERIGERLDGHDSRFDAIDRQLGEHGARFDGIDSRFDGIDRRLDAQGQMLSEILRRLPAGASNVPSGDDDDH